MRRTRIDEEHIHLQHVGKSDVPICGVCGSILEKDDESGEYRCLVCDLNNEQ